MYSRIQLIFMGTDSTLELNGFTIFNYIYARLRVNDDKR